MKCWCGSDRLTLFSNDYLRCSHCGSLVVAAMPAPTLFQVSDDNRDFYGKDYWFSHQERDYNQPNIYQRAKDDLPERCLYWLRTLLKYKTPPGRAIELGSAHGGFVALMHWTGFEAMGLEMSPWIADFAQQTFGVPMTVGPIEKQDFEPASFDVIALMDVLEHLPDPVTTMRHCAELLKPEGILLVQTPCFRGKDQSYEALLADGDPFVRAQLKASEHIFLFSSEAIHLLMERVGCPYVVFESAIFVYDMFFIASKSPVSLIESEALNAVMSSSPSARLVQALIDQNDCTKDLSKRIEEIFLDRQQRIQMINQLNQHIETISVDYEKRGQVIQEIEADRQQRIQMINQLNQHIETMRTSYEADRQQQIQMIELLKQKNNELKQQIEILKAKHKTHR